MHTYYYFFVFFFVCFQTRQRAPKTFFFVRATHSSYQAQSTLYTNTRHTLTYSHTHIALRERSEKEFKQVQGFHLRTNEWKENKEIELVKRGNKTSIKSLTLQTNFFLCRIERQSRMNRSESQKNFVTCFQNWFQALGTHLVLFAQKLFGKSRLSLSLYQASEREGGEKKKRFPISRRQKKKKSFHLTHQ